jgi:hypothetical protein
MMVPWGPKHVAATEINLFLRVTLVYLIKYCCVGGQTFLINYDTQQDAYNEDKRNISEMKMKDVSNLGHRNRHRGSG